MSAENKPLEQALFAKNNLLPPARGNKCYVCHKAIKDGQPYVYIGGGIFRHDTHSALRILMAVETKYTPYARAIIEARGMDTEEDIDG